MLFEDYAEEGEIVRHPQREMLAGDAGGEVPGQSYANSTHTGFPGPDCTGCHYTGTEKSHDFMPTIESCQACHGGLDTFDRTARAASDTSRAAPALPSQVVAQVVGALREMARKAEDVGDRLAEEARRIHYGDAEARDIRGAASRDDIAELLDEGIVVLPVPPDENAH